MLKTGAQASESTCHPDHCVPRHLARPLRAYSTHKSQFELQLISMLVLDDFVQFNAEQAERVKSELCDFRRSWGHTYNRE